MPAATFTSPTHTTTRSRSASPGTARSTRSSVRTKPGDSDDPPHFYEPGGVSATEDRLYVADTNNNKIRTVDLKTHAVKTLALEGLTPPRLAPGPPVFPTRRSSTSPPRRPRPASRSRWPSRLPLAKGFKLNEEVPLTYLVETPEKSGILGPEVLPKARKSSRRPRSSRSPFPWPRPAAAGEKIDLRLSLQTFVCSETSSLCAIKSYVWNVPVTFSRNGGPGADPVEHGGKVKSRIASAISSIFVDRF